MKKVASGILAAMLLSSIALAQVQSHWTELTGNGFVIRTNTGPTQQTCTYSVAVVFNDGSNLTQSGQTDPAVKAQNHLASVWSYGKSVASATITQWNCSNKS